MQQIGGGAPLRLTDDAADDLMPDFSSDGRQLAFRSERDGGGFYVVPTLGGAARRIAAGGRSPRFSPDGTQIAYWTGPWRGTVNTTITSAWVLKVADGTRTRLMPDFSIVREPVWAPDGKSLVVIARKDHTAPIEDSFDWWWVPLDGRPPVRTGALARPELGASVTDLGFSSTLLGSWTSDGVLFTARNNLFVVPISTGDGHVGVPRQLTFGTGPYAESIGGARRHDRLCRSDSSACRRPRAAQRRRCAGAPLFGHVVRPVAAGRNIRRPDAVARPTQRRRAEIWLRSVATGQERMVVSITDGAGAVNSSISPDGSPSDTQSQPSRMRSSALGSWCRWPAAFPLVCANAAWSMDSSRTTAAC